MAATMRTTSACCERDKREETRGGGMYAVSECVAVGHKRIILQDSDYAASQRANQRVKRLHTHATWMELGARQTSRHN